MISQKIVIIKWKKVKKDILAKTFTWRITATLTTMIIAWLVSGDPLTGLTIGGIEFFIKMPIYYFHERAWYKSNFGLNEKKENKWLHQLQKAAFEAGLEILKVYEKDFEVQFKKDNSPLTIADQRANDIIEKYLSETNIPILSEEGKQIDFKERKNWNLLWIVDPLDGTKEFVKKMVNSR